MSQFFYFLVFIFFFRFGVFFFGFFLFFYIPGVYFIFQFFLCFSILYIFRHGVYFNYLHYLINKYYANRVSPDTIKIAKAKLSKNFANTKPLTGVVVILLMRQFLLTMWHPNRSVYCFFLEKFNLPSSAKL